MGSDLKDALQLAKDLFEHVSRNASSDELKVMGLFRDEEGEIHYLDGCERRVDLGDVEHFVCSIYQMIACTLSHRTTNVAQPSQPHHHPSMMDVALMFFSSKTRETALGSIEAFKKLVQENKWPEVPAAFRLRKEDLLRRTLNSQPSLRSMDPLKAPSFQRLPKKTKTKKKRRRVVRSAVEYFDDSEGSFHPTDESSLSPRESSESDGSFVGPSVHGPWVTQEALPSSAVYHCSIFGSLGRDDFVDDSEDPAFV